MQTRETDNNVQIIYVCKLDWLYRLIFTNFVGSNTTLWHTKWKAVMVNHMNVRRLNEGSEQNGGSNQPQHESKRAMHD